MHLSSVISDGMVLQRNAEVSIWGNAGSGRTVKLAFLGQTHETIPDADGNWKIVLDGLQPGGPHEMVIIADSEIVIRDILIGDVWILGGQSNMEWPIRGTLDLFEDDLQTFDYPLIRHFSVPLRYDFHAPQPELAGGRWISANPKDVLDFSAAGFFFAKSLYEKYGVPIGLIQTAVGGTPIEAWMREETIRRIGGYDTIVNQCKDDGYVAAAKQRDEERTMHWHETLNAKDTGLKEGWHGESDDSRGWKDLQIPGLWKDTELESLRGSAWFRKEIVLPLSVVCRVMPVQRGVQEYGARTIDERRR